MALEAKLASTAEQEKEQLASNDVANKADQDDRSSISEVLRAAGVDMKEDDPTEAILTLRMWVLGIGFCIVVSGLNTLYTLRSPSITISSSVVLLLAYPLGKVWEKVIPSWNVPLGAWSFNLNPGPFNKKEHILVYIMSNLSIYVRLGADVLTEQQMFYGYSAGWGFQILITLATFFVGLALAGLFRSIIVLPYELVWPGLLGTTALTSTLHDKKETDARAIGKNPSDTTWKISRYGFFSLVFCISFCWYWFPDFIFPALSYFTFPCWIAPKNKVVNQLFGMKSGMGLLPLTFDWSQISYVGSPLIVPSWAIMNVFGALVFWIWIVAVACYYRNVWYTGHLPFQSSSVFDNTGNKYKASKIVNENFEIDVAKYEAYSPVIMPVTYALNMFGLSFATLTSLVVWIILEKRELIASAARNTKQIITERRFSQLFTPEPKSRLSEVPMWWYLCVTVLALFLSIFSVEYWNAELKWYGVLLACAVALVFFPPLALVYATSNQKINIDIFCRIVAGFVFEGKVLANIWFFTLGYISTIKGLYFAQDMKLGIYFNIPPRKVFIVQCAGIIAGTLSSVSVLNWGLGHISGVCTTDAVNGFNCPFSRTHFNTSLIWGAIGPRRFFNNHIGYHSLLYFFIIGAILPVIVFVARRRYPKNVILQKLHIPLFLGGLNYLPPATGTTYGSWALVGLVFGLLIRKRLYAWWCKYNFVLSSALDSSVSVAGVVIFFAIFYSGASSSFGWWGTKVHKNTCDWEGCAHLPLPESGKFV